MANNSAPSRREAMRLKAEAEEARGKRNGRILWISLAAVALVVVVILAIVIPRTLADNAPAEDQQTPPNASADFGIGLTSKDAEPAADAPNLVVYEDFQCPACAAREEAFGPAIKELVDNGSITTEIRTAHFLDGMLNNDSSERAAMAAAAADAVGKFREFHETVYANQPQEGLGFTDQQLRVDLPALAGIEGEDLTTFQNLYDGRAFQDFVDGADQQFVDDEIQGTPTYLVNGTKLEFQDEATGEILIQPTADDLLRAINEAS